MLNSKKNILAMIVVAVLWSALIVILCLAISYIKLLEIFLVAVGSLIIASGGVLIIREISELINLLHRQRVWRENRDLDLMKRKQGQFFLTIKRKRSLRDRYS